MFSTVISVQKMTESRILCYPSIFN